MSIRRYELSPGCEGSVMALQEPRSAIRQAVVSEGIHKHWVIISAGPVRHRVVAVSRDQDRLRGGTRSSDSVDSVLASGSPVIFGLSLKSAISTGYYVPGCHVEIVRLVHKT